MYTATHLFLVFYDSTLFFYNRLVVQPSITSSHICSRVFFLFDLKPADRLNGRNDMKGIYTCKHPSLPSIKSNEHPASSHYHTSISHFSATLLHPPPHPNQLNPLPRPNATPRPPLPLQETDAFSTTTTKKKGRSKTGPYTNRIETAVATTCLRSSSPGNAPDRQ